MNILGDCIKVICRTGVLVFCLVQLNYTAFCAKNNLWKKSQVVSVRMLWPLSLLEFDACAEAGVQFRQGQWGLEFGYARVLRMNSYSQGGSTFEGTCSGSRSRLNVKYYFLNTKFNDNQFDQSLYVSFMPSIKQVKYRMKQREYDSVLSQGSYRLALSDIPVNYSAKSLCLNVTCGNEFFIHKSNFDFYLGAGVKFMELTIPQSAPGFFKVHSHPRQEGVYFNFLLGAKIGMNVFRNRKS